MLLQLEKAKQIMKGCRVKKRKLLTPTSAVGLHGLAPPRASIPQARRHILPSLALCRRCRLWFSWRKRRTTNHQVLTVDHEKQIKI